MRELVAFVLSATIFVFIVYGTWLIVDKLSLGVSLEVIDVLFSIVVLGGLLGVVGGENREQK